MSTKKEQKPEEKLSISKVAVANKEKSLTIIHDESKVMSNNKILISQGIVRPGDQPVHPDLLDIWQQFVPHFLISLQMPGYKSFPKDYITKKKAVGDPNLDGFIILSVSIGERGLMNIAGGIKKDNGAVSSINANNISMDLDSGAYIYAKELNVIWENLCEACHDYFIDGKFGEGAQKELDLNQKKKEAA